MLIQKERVAALSLLSAAAQKEIKLGNHQAAKVLKEALEEISNAFLLDKSQQAYEMALSLFDTEPDQSLTRLAEAQKLEPKNFTIELQIIRTHLAMGNCSEASNGARALQALNPFSEEVSLALAQSAVCGKDFNEYTKILKNIPESASKNSIFWEMLRAEEMASQGPTDEFKTKLKSALKTHDKFPEVFYWAWKFERPDSTNARSYAQRYSALCTSPTSATRRKYLYEPQFCRRKTEIENYLKSQEL